jgi:hypothetical protein
MSSTRTIGRITVGIGTGIAAVAISLTAPEIASVRPPLCQDDIDCRLQGPTTTSLSPPLPTPTIPPLPTATLWTPTTTTSPAPPPPTTTSPGYRPPTYSRPPSCPLNKPCPEVPFS